MKLRQFMSTAWVLGVVVFLTAAPWCSADAIKAFSLREANRLLGEGQTDKQELRTVGGITRFAGMVFDREGADVILIGKTRRDQPAASLDDLVVALRCRLQEKRFPSVSIDVVEDTKRSGMQAVRFEGGIENTKFGEDFLNSDVILKLYSLDLLRGLQGIEPYLKLYEQVTRKELKERGHAVQDVTWLSEEESRKLVAGFKGRSVSDSKTTQSRFWFYAMKQDSHIVESDDVYVIDELRLGVKTEPIAPAAVKASGPALSGPKDEVGETFAGQFTEHYQTACAAHPAVQRLKCLFDLLCLAEGILHLGDDRPRLDHLLEYRGAAVGTPAEYRLVQRVGLFRGQDGSSTLVQLSGGIELEAILLALEDGEVRALKKAALLSRPDARSLCWTLPLEKWEMCNDTPRSLPEPADDPATTAAAAEPNSLGCVLGVQAFTFDPGRPGKAGRTFDGFLPLRAVPALRVPDLQLPRLEKLRARRPAPSQPATQGRSAGALDRLARLSLEQNWEQVLREWAGAEARPRSIEEDLLLGYAQLYAKNWAAAWQHFSAIDQGTDDQKKGLLAWLENVRGADPDSAMALALNGDALARLGRFDDAVKLLTQAVGKDPARALAYELRGLVRMHQGQYRSAAADLDKALETDPRAPNLLYERGLLELLSGNFREAVSRLTRLLQDQPAFFLARNARGVAYALEAEFPPALEDFERVEHDHPWFLSSQGNKKWTVLLRARGLFALDIQKLAAVSPKGILKSQINMVVADNRSMIDATNLAAASLRKQYGTDVLVTGDLTQAINLAKQNNPVLYQRTVGYDALGESVMRDLNTMSTKGISNTNIIGYNALGNEAGLWGSRRFINDPGGLQIEKFTGIEPGGGQNRLALPSHGENARLAKELLTRGVDVNIITSTGNFGLGRIGEVAQYQKVNVPTFTAQSTSDLDLKLGLSLSNKGLSGGLTPGVKDMIASVAQNGGQNPLSWIRSDLNGPKLYIGTTPATDLLNMTSQVNQSYKGILNNAGIGADRGGVFLRLGPAQLDVRAVKKTDRSLIDDSAKDTPEPTAASDREPNLTFPLLILNPPEGVTAPALSQEDGQ